MYDTIQYKKWAENVINIFLLCHKNTWLFHKKIYVGITTKARFGSQLYIPQYCKRYFPFAVPHISLSILNIHTEASSLSELVNLTIPFPFQTLNLYKN